MKEASSSLKVEIWSDVMCPFCYMGKRKFENALAEFPHADQITIEWKSFQLSPDMKTQPEKSIHQFLAEHKGFSVEQARGMNNQVSAAAAKVGLEYNLDKAIPANSFNAHRLSHLAKQHGLQNEAEEKIFAAYFTDGKNIDDIPTLISIGNDLGMDATEIKTVLESNQFADEVDKDIDEARQIGVRGVPFFVFDRKYAVSGAQESEVFTQTLERVFEERKTKADA